MVDREILLRRVELIRDYGKILKELVALPEDTFVGDPDVYLKAERCLEVLIQAMLDIGGHIISARQLGQPARYDEIFAILGEHGVIDKDLAERLHGLAGLRNILVHAYLELDRARVQKRVADGLGQFEEYVSQVVDFMDETDEGLEV